METKTVVNKEVGKTKAETKAAKHKVEENGSYDFLVDHFASPTTIINVATALAEHSEIDSQVAVKKVESFLENAKLDQTLEVRAGTGKNKGQYLITRVPKQVGDQPHKQEDKREETMKTKIKKKTGVIASMIAFLKNEHTKEATLAHLQKVFPDRKIEGMAATFNIQIGGKHPRLAKKGVKITRNTREDKVYYQVN